MKPLTTWICDTCGVAIDNIQSGLVVWNSDKSGRKDGFKIVHKGACDLDARMQSLGLDDLAGQGGQVWLLSWLSYGPIKNLGNSIRVLDMDGYVDLFRRLQTPWYEEARPYLRAHVTLEGWGDANEIAPYDSDSLRRIAEAGRNSE